MSDHLRRPFMRVSWFESQGTDRFSLTSQLSASRRTYNPCSTACFLHASRAVIGATIRGLLLKPHRFHHRGEKKVIRSLWAWSIVRVEPAQIISFMFTFKEMRNILQEKTSYFTSAPSPTVILPASLPPSFSWRACPLCYPTPTPTLLFVFFFFFFNLLRCWNLLYVIYEGTWSD